MSRINTNKNKIKNYYFIILPNGDTVCYGNQQIIKKINIEMNKLELKGKKLLSYIPDTLKWEIFWDLSNRYQLNHNIYWIHFDGLRYIHLIPKQKGGTSFFRAIYNGIISIADVFVAITNGLITFIKGAIWFAQLIAWFFVDFLDINLLFNDLIGGVVRLTRILVIGATDIFFGIMRYIVNTLFTPIFGGVWGWENNYSNDEETKADGSNGDLVEQQCGIDGNRKCFRTKEGQVPFTIIIATIFMPPLGLFMEYGLSYWINIIICMLLTVFYYLPGLIYALLMIYT